MVIPDLSEGKGISDSKKEKDKKKKENKKENKYNLGICRKYVIGRQSLFIWQKTLYL